MELFKTPNIDFAGKRKTAYFISAGLFVLGLVFLVVRGGLNLGIDFKGGTEIEYSFEKQLSTSEIRAALSEIGLGESEIRQFGGSNEFLIYARQEEGDQDIKTKVDSVFTQKFSDNPFKALRGESIGPKIGGEMRNATIGAIFFALVLILVYIGWRFEFVFALGAIAALFHDVLITLGIFSILNFEITLREFAAFLTIVGYSLNDTIVVYDRVRENLKTMRNENLAAIMNRSINQVLSRTVVTSLTTFVVVLILFLFGGKVIHGFAFAMLIGVMVGTYSSIFVAGSLILEWQLRHGDKRGLKMAKKKR